MSLSFHLTYDLALIRSIIISDRRLYDGMADDTCPAMEDFVLPENPEHWYILCRQEDRILGFWALIPLDQNTAEVHTCLLKWARGSLARRAAPEFLSWVWSNTQFSHLVTVAPRLNRAAILFAKTFGFKETSVQEKHYPKNGTLHDLVHLELRKPEGH